MPRLALVVEFRTHPGRKADFLARLGVHRANVLAHEPGCRQFDILEARDADDRVFLYEVYDGEQALEDHAMAPYFQEYRRDTEPMIAHRQRALCVVAEGQDSH